MYVSFDHIDKTAKSWVYSLEKKCSNHIQDLDFFLKDLCENWKSHNQPVKASYIIYEDSFIILFAENSISGCSIDNSNKLIREKLNDLQEDGYGNIDQIVSEALLQHSTSKYREEKDYQFLRNEVNTIANRRKMVFSDYGGD